ncbi:MAG: helix-turn-helix transcriptional regulator [Clostridia bacterium]|nr:helix-turn-helix transcriptional regulator [Clostridia bacterium]
MELGIKIKRLRLQNNLTQEELADRCELTKGYISQLENELTSPSIQTLEDILNALGTTFAEFFRDEKEEKIVFTDSDFIEKIAEGHKIEWLVPNAQKNEMEPIRVTIDPHSSLSEDMPHEGEEFGYVISGRVHLHLGNNTQIVKKGEAFYFSAGKMHKLENRTAEKAVVLWVASPPTF